MKIKRLLSLVSALVLGFSSLLTIALPSIASAAAPYTCTWTGAGGNNNFSTAANWSGCNSNSPVATDGDNLIFDVTSLGANTTLNNDILSLAVGSLTFQGTNSNYYRFTVTGNGITLNNGIASNGTTNWDTDITLGANQTFNANSSTLPLYIGNVLYSSLTTSTINLAGHTLTLTNNGSQVCGNGDMGAGIEIGDQFSGSGTITSTSGSLVAFDQDSTGFTGNINVQSGQLVLNSAQAYGSGAGTLTVSNGASLVFGTSTDETINEALNLSGTGQSGNPADTSWVWPTLYATYAFKPICAGGGFNDPNVHTVNLAGSISLNSSITTGSDANHKFELSGPISNSYQTNVQPGNNGTLTVNSSSNTSSTPNGTYTAPASTYTLPSTSTDTNGAIVGKNLTFYMDGTQGAVTVDSGGILKGDGKTGSLSDQGGTVSPGHSPGCITVTGNYNEGGTLQEEIGGTTPCTGYDQVIVQGNVTLDNGATPPTQGILQLSLVNGFQPKVGQTFEIINNQGSQPVTDTFAGLPEGSTIKLSGNVYKITYKGGDGNDVVLTVITVATPNTGFGLTSFNTALPIFGTIAMVSGLVLFSKSSKVLAKKR